MFNRDQWVDAIVDELNRLYQKDTDHRKTMLGPNFIKIIFDQYIDWITMNQNMNPIQISRAIYKDLKAINYYDFNRKSLKKGTPQKDGGSFQLIYGTPEEIDMMLNHLAKVKDNDRTRYDLIIRGLEYVREISKKVSLTQMSFTGARMAQPKDKAGLTRMPRYTTFLTFMKMPTKDLQTYVNKLKNDLKKLGVPI